MSEAELHILRSRMDHGRRNKAERGELFNHMPPGYVRLASGEVILDPDEQVQSVVRLIFTKFVELGSARQLVRYLAAQRIALPVRTLSGPERGQIRWREPRPETVYSMLHHPYYAGAYGYGRTQTNPRLKIPGRPSSGRRVMPIEEWHVLLKDTLPAYISWDQFLANQERLRQNCAHFDTLGAPRAGASLLTGLVACGKCGRRMGASYPTPTAHYVCFRNDPIRCCEGQNLAAASIDALVERQVLLALEPAAIALSLKAEEDLRQEDRRLSKHWQQTLAANPGASPLPNGTGAKAVRGRRTREPAGGSRTGATLGTSPDGRATGQGRTRSLPDIAARRAVGTGTRADSQAVT